MYEYKAKVIDIYDADTCTLLIDVGFKIYLKEQVRLIGLDCPELRTKNKKEKELGYEARDYLRNILLGKDVIIQTEKEGKWGRYLVKIKYNDLNINQHLIDKGYAVEYDGGKRLPWIL